MFVEQVKISLSIAVIAKIHFAISIEFQLTTHVPI
jgi:hypothetical protein